MMTDNCPLTKKPMACASITFPEDRCGTWEKIEKCQYCGDVFNFRKVKEYEFAE